MTLRQALEGISAPKYFDICGYSYRSLFKYGDCEYKNLPKDFQDGIIVLAFKVYELSEMVYSYEIDLVSRYAQNIGIKRKHLFISDNLDSSFYVTLSLKRNREAKLIEVKLQCIRILIRLFRYVNATHSLKH